MAFRSALIAQQPETGKVENRQKPNSGVETVLTKEEQDALSPSEDWKSLRAGNGKDLSEVILRQGSLHSDSRRGPMYNFPKAIVLSV